MEKEINDYQAQSPQPEGQPPTGGLLSENLFQELRNKIREGTATEEDEARLGSHLDLLFEQDVRNNGELSDGELEKRESMYRDFQARVHTLEGHGVAPISIFEKAGQHLKEIRDRIAYVVYSRYAVLATALCLAVIVILSLYKNTLDPLQMTEALATDCRGVGVLPDGSIVTITDGSIVRRASNFHQNRVVSLKGKAWFQIMKNKERPFQVQSGNLSITVTGTIFKVSSADARYDTINVSEGSVRVSNGAKVITVRAGQVLVFDKKNNILSLYRFSFTNVSMAKALEDISKHFNIDLKWENEKLKDNSVTASFSDLLKVDQIIHQLTRATGTCYRRKKDVITITDDCPRKSPKDE